MSKGAAEVKKDSTQKEHKEESHSKKPEVPVKGKGHTPVAGGCFSMGCKKEANRFNFCDEHYDHFKFGLIKKTGEPVSDYEKKLGHYLAQKSRKSAQKVA
jgi:hypothetical protein